MELVVAEIERGVDRLEGLEVYVHLGEGGVEEVEEVEVEEVEM